MKRVTKGNDGVREYRSKRAEAKSQESGRTPDSGLWEIPAVDLLVALGALNLTNGHSPQPFLIMHVYARLLTRRQRGNLDHAFLSGHGVSGCLCGWILTFTSGMEKIESWTSLLAHRMTSVHHSIPFTKHALKSSSPQTQSP